MEPAEQPLTRTYKGRLSKSCKTKFWKDIDGEGVLLSIIIAVFADKLTTLT